MERGRVPGSRRRGRERSEGQGREEWGRRKSPCAGYCAFCASISMPAPMFPHLPPPSVHPPTLSVLSLLPLTNMRESDDHAICRGRRESGAQGAWCTGQGSYAAGTNQTCASPMTMQYAGESESEAQGWALSTTPGTHIIHNSVPRLSPPSHLITLPTWYTGPTCA